MFSTCLLDVFLSNQVPLRQKQFDNHIARDVKIDFNLLLLTMPYLLSLFNAISSLSVVFGVQILRITS